MPFSVIGVSETWQTDSTAELVNIIDTILSPTIVNRKQPQSWDLFTKRP